MDGNAVIIILKRKRTLGSPFKGEQRSISIFNPLSLAAVYIPDRSTNVLRARETRPRNGYKRDKSTRKERLTVLLSAVSIHTRSAQGSHRQENGRESVETDGQGGHALL